MKFEIFENGFGKKVISANLNEFEDAVQFIKENTCDGLQLRSPIGTTDYTPDFNKFELIAEVLNYLSIDTSGTLKSIQNLQGIYTLKKLQKLTLAKEGFEINLAKFNDLKQLGIEYHSKIKNINMLSQLEIFVLRKYNQASLEEFVNLKNLVKFHIYQSKIKTVKGIEKIIKLEELNITRNTELKDISVINELPLIKKLHVEKCTLLTNFDFLQNNETIEDLFLTEIDSLSFVKRMPNLKKIHFWNCVDGNMNPLFENKSLKIAYITKDQKHYTHSQAQISEYLKSK